MFAFDGCGRSNLSCPGHRGRRHEQNTRLTSARDRSHVPSETTPRHTPRAEQCPLDCRCHSVVRQPDADCRCNLSQPPWACWILQPHWCHQVTQCTNSVLTSWWLVLRSDPCSGVLTASSGTTPSGTGHVNRYAESVPSNPSMV